MSLTERMCMNCGHKFTHRTSARIHCPACGADANITRSVATLGKRFRGLTVRKMTPEERERYL
jgi:predicted RNA-binding Zn-ribbon protein involved in translation (DUF1610 family)